MEWWSIVLNYLLFNIISTSSTTCTVHICIYFYYEGEIYKSISDKNCWRRTVLSILLFFYQLYNFTSWKMIVLLSEWVQSGHVFCFKNPLISINMHPVCQTSQSLVVSVSSKTRTGHHPAPSMAFAAARIIRDKQENKKKHSQTSSLLPTSRKVIKPVLWH